MNTLEVLEPISIPELIKRFENDIRYGCHSTVAEASRSHAGKELEKRAKFNGSEIIPALTLRLDEMNRQTLNGVEKSVYNGINMLLNWIKSE